MLTLQILSFLLLAFADTTDGLQNGQITEQSKCVLCGGRFLCGAVSETLSIEVFDKKQTSDLVSFCKQKNHAYLQQNINRIPWVSEELATFYKLKKIIQQIAIKKSQNKYTKNRIKSITDDKIAIRVQYRMKNGFPYSEISDVLQAPYKANLLQKNQIIPVFSYETFRRQVLPSKKAYQTYLENLVTAPVRHFSLMSNGYAHIIESTSRSPASYILPKHDIKEKKPLEFYRDSSINSFIKKISRYPIEFCEKMPYQKIMATNRTSIKKISQAYGGQSLIEQNYYYKKLLNKFNDLEKQNAEDCHKSLQTFLNQSLISLPNPEIIQVINHVNQESNSRLPSSIGIDRPVHCDFDINNYQEQCN